MRNLGGRLPTVDFARAPFLVIWEVTRACALACVHCRADAIARRDPSAAAPTSGIFLVTSPSLVTPSPSVVMLVPSFSTPPDTISVMRRPRRGRCGPVALPVEPIRPMPCPGSTSSPGAHSARDRWL